MQIKNSAEGKKTLNFFKKENKVAARRAGLTFTLKAAQLRGRLLVGRRDAL